MGCLVAGSLYGKIVLPPSGKKSKKNSFGKGCGLAFFGETIFDSLFNLESPEYQEKELAPYWCAGYGAAVYFIETKAK